MPFVKTRAAEIFYEVIGDGAKTLTLVNGHTRSSADFRMMTRFMNERGIRCVIFDNRGSGRTVYTPPFSLEDMFQDIAAIWKQENITNSALLGISMGGLISQKTAVAFPQLISKLILVSTAADPKYIMSGRGEWAADEKIIRDKLGRFFSEKYLQNNPAVFESMVKQTYRAIVENNFSERSVDQKNAFLGKSIAEEIQKIQTETLVIHGSEDRAVSLEGAEMMAKQIPGAKLKVFEGYGHLLLAECPKLLYQTVADFIS